MPANLRAIRRKIRTVQNIRQITRAMKMVAAAKLKRIQGQVESGREYWDRLDDIIGRVAANAGDVSHPFLEPGDGEATGVLVIGGARGLCGSYNVGLLRHAQDFVDRQQADGPVKLTTFGAKPEQFFRARHYDIAEAFATPDEATRLAQATEVSRMLRDDFLSGRVSRVYAVYTEFRTAISHTATDRQLLPILPPQSASDKGDSAAYIFEPPAEQLLGSLLPRAVDAAVYRMILSSTASEEGARMASMTAATDNAEELIVQLTRDLNRARQSVITTEILEVIAGADALMSE